VKASNWIILPTAQKKRLMEDFLGEAKFALFFEKILF